jgi:hypothetical protein
MKTKLWGLKKLKLIHKNALKNKIKLNASVIPYKIYSNPEQVRQSHFLGEPRILLRSDMNKTKVRQTVKEWGSLKRMDEQPQEKLVQTRIKEILIGNKHKLNKRTRIIMNPTKKREKIHFSGVIIYKGKNYFKINFKPIVGNTDIHRTVPGTDFYLSVSGNTTTIKNSKIFNNLHSDSKKFIINAINFLNEGIKQNQIKLKNTSFELSFCSFKENQTIPEFYDFLEDF